MHFPLFSNLLHVLLTPFTLFIILTSLNPSQGHHPSLILSIPLPFLSGNPYLLPRKKLSVYVFHLEDYIYRISLISSRGYY